MTQQTWEELTQDLGKQLHAMVDGDTVVLEHGDYYTQCQSAVDDLHADAVSNRHLPPESRLSAAQEERLVAMGWQPPRPPGYHNFHIKQKLPFSLQDAVHLASLMVGALRDVYGVDSPDQIAQRAFNAFD